MNEEIRKAVLQHSTKRLIEMWCEFNKWNWPEELRQFNKGEPTYSEIHPAIAIMHFIQYIVGDKAISREWNNNMTDEEHEEWYKNRYDSI